MKFRVASGEGEFSVIYGEGSWREQSEKGFVKGLEPRLWWDLIIVQMSRGGAAGAKTLAKGTFVAHCLPDVNL